MVLKEGWAEKGPRLNEQAASKKTHSAHDHPQNVLHVHHTEITLHVQRTYYTRPISGCLIAMHTVCVFLWRREGVVIILIFANQIFQLCNIFNTLSNCKPIILQGIRTLRCAQLEIKVILPRMIASAFCPRFCAWLHASNYNAYLHLHSHALSLILALCIGMLQLSLAH